MLHFPTVLFKDHVMAERILQTDSPREQKALGRSVAHFEEGKWKSCCRDIVKKGNLAKVWSLSGQGKSLAVLYLGLTD